MAIDHFTKEQFEAALPRIDNIPLWQYDGLHKGEHCYSIPVLVFLVKDRWITVRSSVRENGHSADTGEDSIRLYLMSPTGPVAGKLTKYVTRVQGWQSRMKSQLRTLYKIGLSLKPCPKCGDLMHAFKVKMALGSDEFKKANVGRLFQKCTQPNARGKGLHGCAGAFEWIVFKEDQPSNPATKPGIQPG